MLVYGVMLGGAAALTAMMYDGLRNATPRRAFVSAVVVLTAWYALCLVVAA